MFKLRQIFRKMSVVMLYAYVLFTMIYLALRIIFADRFWWLALINAFSFYVFVPLLLILPLAIVLKQQPLLLMTSILIAIWLIWISPYCLPKFAHATDKNDVTLRIATFNIWGNNSHLNEVEQYFRDLKADVVVLQETPAIYAMSKTSHIENIYPEQFVQGAAWSNSILSRHQFQKAELISPFAKGNEFTHQRIVIDLGGQDVAIYNVHMPFPVGRSHLELQANFPWFVNMLSGYDDTQRNEEIRRFIALLDNEGLPYIVAGDFNMSCYSPIYAEIAQHAKDAFREAGSGLGFSWPVDAEVSGFPAFVPPLIRIDYIWYSDQFEAIDAHQGPILGSDHLPLWATLRLKPTNP